MPKLVLNKSKASFYFLSVFGMFLSLTLVFSGWIFKPAGEKKPEIFVQEPSFEKRFQEPEYIKGEVLVKFTSSVNKLKTKNTDKNISFDIVNTSELDNGQAASKLLQENNIEKIERVFKEPKQKLNVLLQIKNLILNKDNGQKQDLSRIYKLSFNKDSSVSEMVNILERDPQVEYAEPNYIFQTNFSGLSKAMYLSGDGYAQRNTDKTDDNKLCQTRTIDAWVKLTEGGKWQAIVGKKGSQTSFTLTVTPENKIQYLHYISAYSAEQVVSNTVLSIGEWYHVAAAYRFSVDVPISEKGLYIYINGQKDSFKQSNYGPGTCAYDVPLRIGTLTSSLYRFNGFIDELRLSKVVRYTSDFTLPESPYEVDDNTIALYHFEDNIEDSSVNEMHGSIVGKVDFYTNGIIPTATPTTTSPTPTISQYPNDDYYKDSYPNNTSERDPSWLPAYDYQWNLKQMNIDKAWKITTGSSEVLVGVVDTGIDYTHEELGACSLSDINNNQCLKIMPGYDFINNDNDPYDDNGHGTHVAGIISAIIDNDKGIASISPDIKIVPVKVLSSSGSGSMDAVARGIQYAVDQNVKVINLSLGNSTPIPYIPSVLQEALDYAFASNVAIIAAAGNSSDDISQGYWPANYHNTVSVGAHSENDDHVAFSNYGMISVVAPGGESTCKADGNSASSSCYNILSLKSEAFPITDPRVIGSESKKQYLRLAGTSMSAPHVTGLAALLLSKNPLLSNLELKSLIEYSSTDLGDPGFDKYFGHGKINAENALNFDSPPPEAEVYSPAVNAYFGGVTEVLGVASGTSFDKFTVELGEGESPDEWLTRGIELTDGGLLKIRGDILATIDTSQYSNGVWILKLSVYGSNQTKIERKIKVNLYSNQLSGWPQAMVSNSGGYTDETMFIASDLDNDGSNELFSQSEGEYVYLWDTKGHMLPSFPMYVGHNFIANYNSKTGIPAIGDLDNNGNKEIVFATHMYDYANSSAPPYSTLHLINKDGSYLSGWPKQKQSHNYYSNPVIDDINNDGIKEIIIIEAGSKLHAYSLDGSDISGWPNNISVSSGAILSTGDLDNNGKKDIIVTSENRIYVYEVNPFRLKWLKEFTLSGESDTFVSYSKAILFDLDKDNKLEIVVSVGSKTSKSKGAVFIFKPNGDSYPNWPQNTKSIDNNNGLWNGRNSRSCPVVSDVDKDGQFEILVGTEEGRIMMYKLNGERYNILYGESMGSNFNRSFALSDLSSNGFPDVIAGSSRMYYNEGAFFAWPQNWSWGDDYISGWPRNVLIFSSPQIIDFDKDGTVEVIALGKESINAADKIYIWKENNINPQSYEWPIYACNEQRTGMCSKAQGPTIIPTPTNTPIPPTPTSTPTLILIPTSTNTPVPTATNTPVPTATDTPTPTLVPTATNTPVPPTPTYTPTPSPVPGFCLGDINKDYYINLSDLNTLINYTDWGDYCNACTEDVNSDTYVNLSDLNIVINKINEYADNGGYCSN